MAALKKGDTAVTENGYGRHVKTAAYGAIENSKF